MVEKKRLQFIIVSEFQYFYLITFFSHYAP